MASDTNFYSEHPKTCDPSDFWGQVKRTINGKAVGQDQIDMIVAAATKGLELSISDTLLDLCCGNGALTTYLFAQCAGGVGVDLSEYLIEVAKANFIKRESEQFLHKDVLAFLRECECPERFTKALCYGSLQYLPHDTARDVLSALRTRFIGVKRVFIGNIPDKQHARSFLKDNYEPSVIDSPGAPIGIWRTESEFRQLAAETGWQVEISHMPAAYYWAHYRFDSVLTPS